MIRDFSDASKEREQMEEELRTLKKEYLRPRMSEEQLEGLKMKMQEADMENRRERSKMRGIRFTATAAALLAAFVILPNTSASVAHAMERIPLIGRMVEIVTFRDYEYEGERHSADIEVPEIKLDEELENSDAQEKLEQTADEINGEIREITEKLIKEFETYLEDEQGYQDIVVTSEVLATTPEYFTLKLLCYQGAGSGTQWNYYYTIDLTTGERLQLKDIFQEGADYITPISDSIKEQMQAQMDADETVYYWLHDEIEEWNFKAITDETSFYLNEKGNVVIGFDEGEVAPMYMGSVEFEIPAEAVKDIRQ
mgnify:FL=1|jgi:hypothetical protein